MIPIPDGAPVSALLSVPASPLACYVFAHGAGAGMAHPFMAATADGLAARGIASLRYQFPFMEAGSKRPDRPPTAHAAVRSAIDEAERRIPGVPIVAGGKSFGGRMTSQAQAISPLPGVLGLVFFGFPLHPPKKPAVVRADHLGNVAVPMLFIQGSRDALAEMALLGPMLDALGARATLEMVEGGDHGFHVPRRSGRTDAIALGFALDAFRSWTARLVSGLPNQRDRATISAAAGDA